MTRSIRGLVTVATLAFAGLGGGCAAGGWEDVLYGGPSRGYEVTGEVNRVDSRSRTIDLRDDRGRSTRVRYDGSTRVVYRGRRYQPTALERGDLVTVRVERDRRGDLLARNVVLRRDARDRYGRGDDRRDDRAVPAGRQTLEGRVNRISRNDGRFEVRTGNRTVWVNLPYRPHRTVEDRFHRLRQGDQVRVQGRWVGDRRFEIERFR